MIKTLTCIVCPIGCQLQVDIEQQVVTGNTCKRGAVYGLEEVTHPTRVITSTVKLNSKELAMLPVKTRQPISKDLNFECIEVLRHVEAKIPVKIGDVIVENVLGAGVDIVATRSVAE